MTTCVSDAWTRERVSGRAGVSHRAGRGAGVRATFLSSLMPLREAE